ncbi:hypothetical protein MMC26_006455 [Xylographa opegraphella]|nr:hypothetical protein [Xylographa opegraphella]
MPYSPHRRRRSSALSFTSSSPQSITFTPARLSHSRKSSIQSLPTPTTPRPPSSHDRMEGFNFSRGFGGSAEAENGLGNLADELAEAWDEGDEGEEEEDVSSIKAEEEDVSSIKAEDEGLCVRGAEESLLLLSLDPDEKDIIGVAISSKSKEKWLNTREPPEYGMQPKPQRKETAYNSPDNSEHVEIEELEIPASLETRMAVIHALAKQGAVLTGMEANSVFVRITDSLKDLTAQADVESHSTRLSTAHTALTTHIMDQTRLMQALTHPVLSPVGTPPSVELTDALLSLLPTLILSLPQAPTSALPLLHSLSASTTDLLSTLSYLSDTLHMARQTTTLAARRLRATRDAVESMRREVEEAEQGMRWIETGGWDERLKDREAARLCGEVVGGFEEVCAGWRERLTRQSSGGVEVGAG